MKRLGEVGCIGSQINRRSTSSEKNQNKLTKCAKTLIKMKKEWCQIELNRVQNVRF